MGTGLKDKKVLILGSSRGIGLGIAQAFVQEQANVMISARQEEYLKQAENYLKSLGCGQVCAYQGDLLQSNVIEDIRKTVKDQWGRLDHLVCNIGSGRSVSPGTEDIAEVRRVMEINFFQAVQAVAVLRPLLRKTVSQGEALSTITLIGSICGRQVLGCPSAYAAAKAALLHYAKNLAKPLAIEGIRINVVSPGNIIFPGSVWEEKLKTAKDKVQAMLEQDVPLKKLGTPEDVASAVVYLSSVQAGFITGSELVVDGGQSN